MTSLDELKVNYEKNNPLKSTNTMSNLTPKVAHQTGDLMYKEDVIIDEIDITNKYMKSDNDADLYDLFLKKQNIDNNENKIIEKKYYININSSKRNKNSSFTVSQYYNLENNPLFFEDGSNIMKIKFPNAKNTFSIDDKIVLNGFPYYKIYLLNTNLNFTVNSNEVKLDYSPNFSFIYPDLDLFMKIEINNSPISIFENIPLHLLTQTHKLHISNDNKLAFDLPITFIPSNISNTILTITCNLYFYQIGNIPLSYINATYPISSFSKIEYHTIVEVAQNYIGIKLYDAISLLNTLPLNGYYENNLFYTGGNSIQIGLINNIIIGYPKPNNYLVYLEKAYRNVIKVKMTSSEVPHINRNITTKNNMFFWNNLIDEYIYSIEISQGYYTIQELLAQIENKVNTTPTIPTTYYGVNVIPHGYNIIKTNYNSNDGIISFESFNKFKMPNCIANITQAGFVYTFKIKHNNHNLKIGDKITISNAINTNGISAKYINGEHIITAVLNNNFYEFEISYINDIYVNNNEYGGLEIIIVTPNTFRIHFNVENSFAELLGFDKLLTNYQNTIQNVNKIYNLELYTDNYILVKCDKLNDCIDANSNIKYFYKILLDSMPNTVSYNSFVDNPIYFPTPLEVLEELQFTFINKDGELLDFNNVDNSFTLEITTITVMPYNTLRNPQIGAI